MAERDDNEEFDAAWSELTGEAAEEPEEEAEDQVEEETKTEESEEEEGETEPEEEKSEDSTEEVDKSDDLDDNESEESSEEESEDNPQAVLLRENKELQHKVNSERGRQVALQQELRKAREEKAALEAQLKASEPQDLPEEWSELETKFPAIAKAVAAKTDADAAQLRERIKELEAQNVAAASQLRQREAEAYLDEHNPGWRDVNGSQEFKDWLGQQSQLIQNLYYSDDVSDNSELLKIYTGSFTPPAQKPAAASEETEESPDTSTVSKRQKQLESSAKVPSSSVDVDDLNDDDFESAFAEAARAEDKRLSRRF